MPKPIQINLEEIEQNPDRAFIKYGNKAVITKMYSINPATLNRWIRIMGNLSEFADGVIHPSHKIVLIELDKFDQFLRWLDKNRYRSKYVGGTNEKNS